VNVVEVTRQIRAKVDRDIKKGEEIRINYSHPYPVKFANRTRYLNLAKINMDVPAFTLTAEYLESVKKK